MNPFEALGTLESELLRGGVALHREAHDELRGEVSSPDALLTAFHRFAVIPAEEPGEQPWGFVKVGDDSDDDLLLHESGEYEDGGYSVSLTRQFSFADAGGEYAGMYVVSVRIVSPTVPAGRIPTAQRWGYGGARREDVSDTEHGEMSNWAGHADSWVAAVRSSNSWKALGQLPGLRFIAIGSDV